MSDFDQAAPDLGQGGDEGPVDSGQAMQGGEQPQSSFLSYEHDDGEVMEWKSPDEVKKYLREGTLRHGDYTKKTQEVAQQRKQFEQERKQWEAERAAHLQTVSQYMDWDKKLKSNPSLRQAIQQAMRQNQRQGKDVDSLLEERLGPVQQKLQEFEKRQQEEAQRKQEQQEQERAFGLLEKSYEDFDRNAIQKAVDKLQQTPPGDSMRALYELVHLAEKGRVTPGQLEKQIAERERRNRSTRAPMSSGSADVKPAKSFATFEEAAAEARKNRS